MAREHKEGWPQPCAFCRVLQHSPKAMKHHKCRATGPVDGSKYQRVNGDRVKPELTSQ